MAIWHFAENRARNAPAQRSFDPVNHLDDLDPASENRKERAVSPLMNGELSGTQMQVGGCPREQLEFGHCERREQRDCSDIVNR